MNKQEFINRLTIEISKYQNPKAVADIVADFNEHFDEAMLAGQSEAEVCAILGDPAEIAAECNEEMNYDAATETSIQTEAKIHINLYEANLVLALSDSDRFDVLIQRGSKNVNDGNIQVTRINNTLKIMQYAPVGIVARLLRIFEHRTVVVYIPKHFDGNIYAKVSRGNVKIMDITTAESVILDVTTGNTKLTNSLIDGKLQLNSRTGNVRIENCVADAELDCHFGNILIKKHRGNTSAVSATGNIKLETDHICRDSIIKTKTGNINVVLNNLSANLDLACKTGNIRLTVNELSGNIVGKTSSGNIKAFLGENVKAVYMLQSSGVQNDFTSSMPQKVDMPTVSLNSRHGTVKVKKI